MSSNQLMIFAWLLRGPKLIGVKLGWWIKLLTKNSFLIMSQRSSYFCGCSRSLWLDSASSSALWVSEGGLSKRNLLRTSLSKVTQNFKAKFGGEQIPNPNFTSTLPDSPLEKHLFLNSSNQTIIMLIIEWANVIREMGSERVIYRSHTDPGDPIQGAGRQ